MASCPKHPRAVFSNLLKPIVKPIEWQKTDLLQQLLDCIDQIKKHSPMPDPEPFFIISPALYKQWREDGIIDEDGNLNLDAFK